MIFNHLSVSTERKTSVSVYICILFSKGTCARLAQQPKPEVVILNPDSIFIFSDVDIVAGCNNHLYSTRNSLDRYNIEQSLSRAVMKRNSRTSVPEEDWENEKGDEERRGLGGKR